MLDRPAALTEVLNRVTAVSYQRGNWSDWVKVAFGRVQPPTAKELRWAFLSEGSVHSRERPRTCR